MTAGEQGNYPKAEQYFQQGLFIARQIGHREWISALLCNLGEAANAQGHYIQAQDYFRDGLIFARQIEHREWISVLLLNLGLTTRKLGNYKVAEVYLQDALTLARQVGIPQITCNSLYEIGNLYLDQQHIEAAEAAFREMLLTIPKGGQDLTALAQYGLARIAVAQDKINEARRLGEASVTALETMGHRSAEEARFWLDKLTY